MHNNYYFLKQLTLELKEKLQGYHVAEIFSQNKNELVTGLTDGNNDFYIRAYLNPDFCCLVFPSGYTRAHKNSISLFPELIGLQITDVVQLQNERSFLLNFNKGYRLLFKMHGNRSNVILLKDRVISIFRNSLVKDFQINPDNLNRPLEQSFERFKEEQGNYKKLFPTFGPLIQKHLEEGAFSKTENLHEKWEIIQDILRKLSSPPYFITKFEDVITLSAIETGEVLEVKHQAIEAINDFFYIYSRYHFFEKEKNDIIRMLERQKMQSLNYVEKAKAKLNEIENSIKNEEIANIIMANLHQIPPKAEEVELLNFYTNQPIKIKLKKGLSPQKNAESYYRKAKNQKIEIERLYENMMGKEEEIKRTEEHIQAIGKISQVKDLRSYIKENKLEQNQGKQTEVLPYKAFRIEGFDVWVGKNAQSNDILTLKHAWKEDLWLHAKDVSGSHVVLKHQAGKVFPKTVIEKAAQLAAYYSKRKTDSLCPVIVTPKKFVRKRKGAAPGAVVVDKEEVILVEPANFSEVGH